MAKKSILFLLLLFITAISYGQSFMHSAGINILIMNTKVSTPYGSNSHTTAFSNLTYFPRFNIMETEGSSISIGAPVGAGIGITRTEDATMYWGFDLPAVIDYNIGWKSTPDNEQRFGLYFGGGFGYTFTNWSDGDDTEKNNSYGPIARAGVRIGGFADTPIGIGIGLSYKSGLESQKFKTYGILVSIDF